MTNRTRMQAVLLCAFICALACLSGAAGRTQAAETLVRPPLTPRISLNAEFTQSPRFPVYEPGQKITVWLRAEGWRQTADRLLWSIADWQGDVLQRGELPVAAGAAPWEEWLKLPDLPSGYYEVNLRLQKAGVTIARAGTRPEGIVTFGILPRLSALPLASADDSRFGAQGTNFIKSGTFMKGDDVSPVYPTLGLKWVYRNRRLAELFAKGPDSFKPETDPQALRGVTDYSGAAGLCVFVDAHSVPGWLTRYPQSVKPPAQVNPTPDGQCYPPSDYEAYGKLIAAVAKEQAARQPVLYPHQKSNYYEIHWEPDWHWKGTDEEFIEMYRAAHRAIHENDSNGVLLGANYGVLAAGNAHLSRLFKKGLGQYLDGIVTHTYFIRGDTPEEGLVAEGMRDLLKMARLYLKPGAKVINSEWGVEHIDIQAQLAGGYRAALLDETSRFMQGHLTVLGEGANTTFYFYIADGTTGGGLLFNLTSPNPVYGSTHVAPKPLTMAATLATRLLEGTKTIGPVETLGDTVRAYAFDRNGETVIAYWSIDGLTHEIALTAGTEVVRSFSAMGADATVSCDNGVFRALAGPVPAYVLGVKKSALGWGGLRCASTTLLPGDALMIENASFFPDAAYQMIQGNEVVELGTKVPLPIPATTNPGKWRLLARSAADGRLLDSGQFTVTPVVELSADAAFTNVTIKNRRSVPAKGVLSIWSAQEKHRASGGGAPEQDTGKWTFPVEHLAGHASMDVPVEQLSLAIPSAKSWKLHYLDATGAFYKTQVPASTRMTADRRTHTIDGKLDDWLLEAFQTTSGAEYIKIMNAHPFGGDGDLSFRYAIHYDDNALYLAFRVRDQSHCQEEWDNNAWKEDSVQIGVGLHPQGDGWGIFHKYCFALSTKVAKGKMGYRNNGTSDAPVEQLAKDDPSGVRYEIVRDMDETVYEIAIPWSVLDRSLSTKPAEKLIGIGIFVNDVDLLDGFKTGRKAMEFGGGMQWTRPDELGKLILK